MLGSKAIVVFVAESDELPSSLVRARKAEA
jgi:hypothetical protein